MKRVLVHIGTPKTGSSSIQATLAAAVGANHLNQVCYPQLHGRDHYFLPALYRQLERLPRGLRRQYLGREKLLQKTREAVREELFAAISRHENLIISAESLTSFDADDVRAFIADLRRCGVSRVGVLVYVRDPAALYLSAMQQRLKTTHLIPTPSHFRYNFIEAIDAWSPQVSNLIVRPFDRPQLRGGDVVHDFVVEASTFFGHPILHAEAEYRTVNESISAEAMLLLQRYQRSLRNGKLCNAEQRRQLLDALQQQSALAEHTRPVLKRHWVYQLRANHRPALDALRERFGVEICPRDESGGQPLGAAQLAPAIKHVAVENLLLGYDGQVFSNLVARYLPDAG